MNRRSFLRGLLGATALVPLAKIAPARAFGGIGGWGPEQTYTATPQLIALLQRRMDDAWRITRDNLERELFHDSFGRNEFGGRYTLFQEIGSGQIVGSIDHEKFIQPATFNVPVVINAP